MNTSRLMGRTALKSLVGFPRVAGTSLLLGLVFLANGEVRAQGAGDGFLFSEPRVTFSAFGGWAIPRAGSEIFNFVQDELTLTRNDFSGLAGGVELGVRVSPRLDVVIGIDGSGSSGRAEFRDWVGADDLPIEQDTDFSRMTLGAGVKAYLAPRGRAISQLAWIPQSIVPWVGAGGGVMWYDFEQRGEFVDYETYDIFEDYFRSSGGAPTAWLSGGFDMSLAARWFVTTQARYQWASSDMSRDFIDFDAIDLSGFRASVGLGLRF
jgi:hypothetical protein